MTAIQELADAYVEEHAALAPCEAMAMGIVGYEAELNDFSPEGYAARAELDRGVLAKLRDTPVEGERDRVTAAVLGERLGVEVELYEAGLRASELSVIHSPLQQVKRGFDLLSAETEEGARTVTARLRAVPGALEGYRRSLREAAARGRVPALRQVRRCAEHCDRWVSDGYFTNLAAAHGDGPVRPELDAGVAAASAEFSDFARFLRDELAPLAPERDAVGRERYALWSRLFTGARLDLDETYAWGWEELARLREELRATAGRISPGASVPEAIEVLERDPARRVLGEDRFRAWMQELSDRAIDALAGTHFDIPEPLRTLECRIAPSRDGGIYYTRPTEDFSRPGRMWWTIHEGEEDVSTWRAVTTVYHEGVPGHHLQLGQTVYLADRLNRYQRFACRVSGYSEGWALYAERLMAELGYLDDPGERLGMLQAQAFRATRVVLDIGMHLELPIPAGTGFHEGERWNPELGLELLLAEPAGTETFMRTELDRYLGWPGQAPSYKLGEREWLAAREDARRRLGDRFDLRAFHSSALDLGPVGLDALRAEMARI